MVRSQSRAFETEYAVKVDDGLIYPITTEQAVSLHNKEWKLALNETLLRRVVTTWEEVV